VSEQRGYFEGRKGENHKRFKENFKAGSTSLRKKKGTCLLLMFFWEVGKKGSAGKETETFGRSISCRIQVKGLEKGRRCTPRLKGSLLKNLGRRFFLKGESLLSRKIHNLAGARKGVCAGCGVPFPGEG